MGMPAAHTVHVIEAPAAGGRRGARRTIALVAGATRELLAAGPLVRQLVARAVRERYGGSHLGVVWAFLNPLILLAVYTIVFATVFNARFSTAAPRSPYEFGVILFSALVPYNYFAEVVAGAPLLVVGHVSYVKRVVFPLHVLPLVAVVVGLVHATIGLVLFAVAAVAILGGVPATAVALPLVWLPLVIVALALVYLLAAVGVFLRDVGQVIGPLLMALFFMSPVFYPAAALPEVVRPFYWLNPLGVVVENTRRVLALGELPQWRLLAIWTAVGGVALILGFAVFVRSRPAFNDVL